MNSLTISEREERKTQPDVQTIVILGPQRPTLPADILFIARLIILSTFIFPWNFASPFTSALCSLLHFIS